MAESEIRVVPCTNRPPRPGLRSAACFGTPPCPHRPEYRLARRPATSVTGAAVVFAPGAVSNRAARGGRAPCSGAREPRRTKDSALRARAASPKPGGQRGSSLSAALRTCGASDVRRLLRAVEPGRSGDLSCARFKGDRRPSGERAGIRPPATCRAAGGPPRPRQCSPAVTRIISSTLTSPRPTSTRADAASVSMPSPWAMWRISSSLTSPPAATIAARMAGEK